jgi:pimeloyl-ACP methyl ester carboxylesterase
MKRVSLHTAMKTMAMIGAFLCLFLSASAQQSPVKNILLIHGAFADGSGWEKVYKLLTARGYNVIIVQIPLSSLEDDVAAVKRALDRASGAAILVGHSWGGAVISEAGTSPQVAGLVYVSALQPDAGESALSQIQTAPAAPENGALPPDKNGLLYYDKAKFHAGFCADLPASKAAFMFASQIPVSVKGFGTPLTHAAWRSKPAWGIFGTADKSINPVIMRTAYKRSHTTIVEIPGASHVAFISHPKEVADIIETAAKGSAK